MVSVVEHLPPDVKQDLCESLFVIMLVLLINGQSLQPLPSFDKQGVL